jgi:hypothetical protein
MDKVQNKEISNTIPPAEIFREEPQGTGLIQNVCTVCE